jgi:hypothetical protein
MTYQFIRSYRLRVIDGNDVYVITDNRLRFKITKTSSWEPNKALVYIYNLSADTSSIFNKDNIKIQLECGYINDAGLIPLTTIFVGNIVNTRTYRQGVDTISEIELGDAQNEVLRKIVNKTFTEKRTYLHIVNYIISVMRIPVREETLKLIPNSKVKNEDVSYTLSGRASDVLAQLLVPIGINFTIQNYQLIFYPIDKRVVQEEAYRLNYDTGLISTEKMIESGINSLFIAGNIYTVKALINPAVYPTQIIYLESEINKLDGQYKVLSAEYSGDTHDGDWLMKLEVEQNVSKD